jgi:EAL domain-containing protein (putative c-di-GMP-specific phosphodiesterase class I)
VSVNVSPAEITDPAFPARVAAVLRSTGLDPEALALEVTEDGLLGNRDAAHLVTRKLKELGVKLALDDFGTGYSSLAHLHEIPLDTLKIDRAFVSRVDGDPRMERMLAAVVGLAHQLGLEVIAEGIERPSEAEVLRRLGCRYGQGYLFGRPAPVAASAALLAVPQPR